MKTRNIVLASVLKPTNDTRMFAKMAMTLARQEEAEVTVIGFEAGVPGDVPVKVISLGRFERLSLARWFASFKVLRILSRLKPQVLVVNTHELLIVAVVSRILFGSRLIYDVQENYLLNILYGEAFPMWARWPLARWVRLKEWLTAPAFHHFILAERSYADEIKFFGTRYTIIENKCLLPPQFARTSTSDEKELLFSGTLAESTGVFRAISLAKALRQHEPAITLTIIGFCPHLAARRKLFEIVRQEPWITLIGGNELVPHDQIFDSIAKTYFGIIAYPPSPHTQNATPTKLFEYLACQLPILLTPNQGWIGRCAPYSAAIVVDFELPDVPDILRQMQGNFYTVKPKGIFWEDEGEKLNLLVSNLP